MCFAKVINPQLCEIELFVIIYAINYNGTGENKLVAHAYNRTTPHDKQIQLDEAANSKVYFIAEGSSYLTNVYFSEDFDPGRRANANSVRCVQE